MLIVARGARSTFLVLVAIVVLFTVLGARPVEPVKAYGQTSVAADPIVHDVDEEAPTSSAATVPAGVRAGAVAFLALGGAATIATVTRLRPQPVNRRAAVVVSELRF